MQFAFGHGPLEAQDEPVIEHGGMVDAVRVGDQGIGHPGQV
jgi:hypothetical protein